ncbi:MAG: sensor histidine kinase [Butyricimonas virosa]
MFCPDNSSCRSNCWCYRNLVDNAVKYSGDVAEVTITVYRERKYLIITVADRGKGIAEKDLPYIFEEYWRLVWKRKQPGMVWDWLL